VILHRRSVRSYKPEPIPEATPNMMLQAGCAAPHGGPEEPWRSLVIRSAETKEQLLDGLKWGIDRAYGGPRDRCWWTFFAEASVVIAVLVKPTSMGEYPGRVEYGIGVASAACAIENMLLASAALGLGAC
jgi:nitroreductase